MIWDKSQEQSDKNQAPFIGMRPMRDSWIIVIDITNACHLQCAHCTRAVRHVARPFFMSPIQLCTIVENLRLFPRGIGIIGGEPTLHPDFPEICQILATIDHPGGYGLFTAIDPKRNFHRRIIERTFDKVYFTDHTIVNAHHPWLCAAFEMIPDTELRHALLDKCWLQHTWSASVTPKGAFFCEMAGVIDELLGGPGGFPPTPGWWNREDIETQIARYCGYCGMSVPSERLYTDKDGKEVLTPDMYRRLLAYKSPWILSHRFEIDHRVLTAVDIQRRELTSRNLSYIQNRRVVRYE